MAQRRWPEEFEPDVEPEGWRKVGAMVIRFAVLDLNHQSPAVRQRARNWLLEADAALEFWAAVCGTNLAEVRACVQRVLEDGGRE